jgi:DNA-binding transcriptional LysR family regulator
MDRVLSMLSFVKVVDKGGFSSAARELNLSTSMVTTHVKSLEDRLGVRLLNRTTRTVSLTEAGHAYYDRCVQILSSWTTRMRRCNRCKRNRAGRCGSMYRPPCPR